MPTPVATYRRVDSVLGTTPTFPNRELMYADIPLVRPASHRCSKLCLSGEVECKPQEYTGVTYDRGGIRDAVGGLGAVVSDAASHGKHSANIQDGIFTSAGTHDIP